MHLYRSNLTKLSLHWFELYVSDIGCIYTTTPLNHSVWRKQSWLLNYYQFSSHSNCRWNQLYCYNRWWVQKWHFSTPISCFKLLIKMNTLTLPLLYLHFFPLAVLLKNFMVRYILLYVFFPPRNGVFGQKEKQYQLYGVWTTFDTTEEHWKFHSYFRKRSEKKNRVKNQFYFLSFLCFFWWDHFKITSGSGLIKHCRSGSTTREEIVDGIFNRNRCLRRDEQSWRGWIIRRRVASWGEEEEAQHGASEDAGKELRAR